MFTPNYNQSVIKNLVTMISEEDFDVSKEGQVEIIGWLYQYYNSEPKDEAFKKKKYDSSEIPAVTQLFTPDWIVKYLVENSLGRYWIRVLHARGDKRSASEIASNFAWKYFMPEAKQEQDLAQPEFAEKKVEAITFDDPAMGSGHILIYAFEVFLQIYESEGYSRRDAAKSVVENNLHGFDIDRRAFQLTYFAVMMKFRAENRRALRLDLRPNVFEVPTTGLTLADFGIEKDTNKQITKNLAELLANFKNAKELGSLLDFSTVQLNDELINSIVSTKRVGQLSFDESQSLEHHNELSKLIAVGTALQNRYVINVTNPPYMGSGKMPSILSRFVSKHYPASKSDLFAAFIERLHGMTDEDGLFAMITQHQWMFLSSFKALRERMMNWPIINMAHLGTRAFEEIGGEVVQTTAFVIQKHPESEYVGTYERLVNFDSQSKKQKAYLEAVKTPSLNYVYRTNQTNFEKIPGSPIAYWASKNLIIDFEKGVNLDTIVDPKAGLTTGDNALFLRQWFEVSSENIFFNAHSNEEATKSSARWFPYNKGGSYRKWSGNYDFVVDWKNNGVAIRNFTRGTTQIKSRVMSSDTYFHSAITWSLITSGGFSIRYRRSGSIHDSAGKEAFGSESNLLLVLGLLNSKLGDYIFKLLNPTINMQIGDFRNFPVLKINSQLNICGIIKQNIELSDLDWNVDETSWDFLTNPLSASIAEHNRNWTVEAAFNQWKREAEDRFNQLKSNEEELNRIFIDLYGLQDELSPEEDDKEVSVRKADLTRDIKAFISYFIGCVFGRYSIDTPGLAFAGGSWDSTKYETFKPSADDFILLTDEDYFGDSRDIINRFKEFLTTTFGEEHLAENMKFIANALGKRGSTPEEQIRSYIRDDFYKKDHLSTYQKRPIYWELNSGRNGGFVGLMYLHRYNTGTMAMIRTKYLHPLQEAYKQRLEQLQNFAEKEKETRQKNAYKKQISKLTKQMTELVKYDEQLQHVANLNIDLDLDDGVLVNHEKLQAGTKILTPIK
ncbi:BREX-1 system adenine-specific DNA-methyltransferase PglX [Lacticaseibacillus casei]|uniref:BREX-1 system adenine-specific DNA-methyltransferase PglX n=1 Tax=Lacticaseibacillus casei TaxID=1582 RepID=UPI0024944BF0|nr:BREX-1 system adenine-specific DNA-methyltransferase PglX [Lacticaseibacillus casei]MCK2082178.1 BREX-1 system adenine-specific DNA-methyltransferase PglX [Lacticaseibacillus casei]